MTADHHSHNHSHSHGHSHGMGNEKRVMFAMWLTGGFMVLEAVGGIVSGSLALLADAGHMLTDTGALMLAFVATKLARRPADEARSYGYARAEILAAAEEDERERRARAKRGVKYRQR